MREIIYSFLLVMALSTWAQPIDAALAMIPQEEVPEIQGDSICPLRNAFTPEELEECLGGRWTLLGDRNLGCLIYSGGTVDPYVRTVLYKVLNDSVSEVYNEYGRYVGMDSIGFYVFNGACCCNEWNELYQLEWNSGDVVQKTFRYHRDTKVMGTKVIRQAEYNGYRRTTPERIDTIWEYDCYDEVRFGNCFNKMGAAGEVAVVYDSTRWIQCVQSHGDSLYKIFWTEKQLPAIDKTEIQLGRDKFFFRTIDSYNDSLGRFDYLQNALIEDSVDVAHFRKQLIGVDNGYSLACGHYIDCFWFRGDSLICDIQINPFCQYYWMRHASIYYTHKHMFDSLSVSSHVECEEFRFSESSFRAYKRLQGICAGSDELFMVKDDYWGPYGDIIIFGNPNIIDQLRRKFKRFVFVPDSQWE